MGRTKPGPFPDNGPLALQDHGNNTRFRNIWYRELPLRASEGGTDGWLGTEATTAKRQEIAAAIRADAATLADPANPRPQMLRLLESLVYEKDAATLEKAQQMAVAYVAKLKALPADQLPGKRDEARQMRDTFRYLARWKILAEDFGPKVDLEAMIRDQGWDRRPAR